MFGEWLVVFVEVLFRACVVVDLAHVSLSTNVCGLRRYFPCFFMSVCVGLRSVFIFLRQGFSPLVFFFLVFLVGAFLLCIGKKLKKMHVDFSAFNH